MSIGVDTQEYRPPPPPEDAGPPSTARTPREWLRENLFNSWYNGLLTLVLAPAIAWLGFRALRFVFVTARWQIIEVNLTNFMVGLFPRTQLWRPWASLAILAVVVGFSFGVAAQVAFAAAQGKGEASTAGWRTGLRRAGPGIALVLVIASFVRTPTPLGLLAGVVVLAVGGYVAGRRLPHERQRVAHVVLIGGLVGAYLTIVGFGGVGLTQWGGLMLTAFFTVGGIALSFPLGVALALGRRSSLPAVRAVCVVYIEVFRGVPLVAWLFMGWLVLGFMIPGWLPVPGRIGRALIIFILFTAAYVAEIVRGGLQSIPRGQREAAQALGLSPWKQTRLIILPQALRNVIPALVGQFISLYKDTSLVFVIALLDLLAVARRVTQQPGFLGQGLHAETLIFISFIYWVGSYWMSRESQRLEARLGVGER